ncbi:hypothetical protein [Geminocystis sp. NIES-3709]|uniref:hypothetical protein n=1 Tax=Geminocystis sp. NIES-3709 TaxID=1617448 RepID=UPI0005FCD6E4|nr:hypothetical protein [Geminocystis sp. NIES-3709]BAQ66031.1 hypothetical protein GM3709_2796 [Geminocystis sp. NIES-3709]
MLNTLCKQVLINPSASIGHDAIVEDYVTFGPGCVICGHCTIGGVVLLVQVQLFFPK